MFNKAQNSGQKIAAKSKLILSSLEKTVSSLEALKTEGEQAIIDNNKVIKQKEEENETINETIEKGSNFVTNFRNLFNKPETKENAN